MSSWSFSSQSSQKGKSRESKGIAQKIPDDLNQEILEEMIEDDDSID